MFRNITLLDSNGASILRCVTYHQFRTSDATTRPRALERFRHLEQYTFPLYPKNIEITLEHGNNGNKFFSLERELARFGPLVNEIFFSEASGEIHVREFLAFVKANLYQWELKSLKIANSQFERVDVDQFGTIFQKLEKLELSKCEETHFGVYEDIILQCKQLKELTLIDLDDFDGDFLLHFTGQLETLHLQNIKSSENSFERCAITIGNRTRSLILRHVAVVIECPSKDLSNLHTLKMCLFKSIAPGELLAYTGNQLKHLHLAKITSDGRQIRTIGNQLRTLSLLKCPNFRCEYIYELLQNNKNLRSVKLYNVGNESLFQEIPRQVPKVEELCIWPAHEDHRHLINFDDIVMLQKLKSFTFILPKYCTKMDVMVNLIDQLARMGTLKCLGLMMRPQDLKKNKFGEKFFQFKNLTSLKLVIWGPQSLNQTIAVEIAIHFAGLEELKIMNNSEHNFDNFHDACCCRNGNERFPLEITVNQFMQILRARKRVKFQAPLRIYQGQGQHRETARMLASQLDAHKNVLRILPLDNDGFFEFFSKMST